ncbi:UNVERIFIED_CONTAM: hypothetical protein GTU68_031015 [Idotea baltica]|nr:hypothetical protein [Idotea baltica]
MPTKTGILLLNLGTPDSPKTSDVRKYLVEFLTDPRVIDIPAVPRQLLVRGIIGPFRSPKSAKIYKDVWTDEGSPLLVISENLRDAVSEQLGEDYQVELAMRYQSPSIQSVLERFKGVALKKLKVIPLFPQYASASTGSALQEVMRVLSTWQTIPDVELVNSFPVDELMIQAHLERAKEHDLDSYDHILFSYHGLPERQLIKADEGNHCECYATTKALAEGMGLKEDQYTTCFQSRLGKQPWKEPYTSDVIEHLAKEKGAKRLLGFCPAFTADCLETIIEMGVEYHEEFREHGGEQLTLVEGLNTHPKWIESVVVMCTTP